MFKTAQIDIILNMSINMIIKEVKGQSCKSAADGEKVKKP